MKWSKKITSIALAFCVFVSAIAIGNFSVSAVKTTSETVASPVDSDHPELAQDTIQGSAILHCFCWSYDTIRQNLTDIKAAGYTAVQTSPVQPPKDYNVNKTTTKDEWWKLYQPLDLAITNGTNYNSWLGTKQQLTQLCTEADNYGIKVIVDIVSNHLACNAGESLETMTGEYINYLHNDVSADLKNRNYFYDNIGHCSDDSRFQMTHGHLGMPELNTSNAYIQTKVLNLMKECVDCGVDGFRFDTTKHIELPTDGENTKSDFWPTVINGINDYQTQKGGTPLYIYGEILGDAYSKDINRKYAQYMDLTDDYTTYRTRQDIKNNINNYGGLSSSTYQKEITAEQAVLWAESHDTYLNAVDKGGNSKNDSIETIVKTWAFINARADATSLFFVRPGVMVNGKLTNATMGSAGTDVTWKSKAVVESNKFKNLFEDQGEYISYDSTYKSGYIERGTKGVVIVKTNGAGSVSLTAHNMADGTYTDHVSDTTFTVSGGIITGTVGATGVAVIYNDGDTEEPHITAPVLYMKPEYKYWSLNNERYAMYVNNNKANTWVDMTDLDGDGIFEAAVPSGKWTNVIFCRMNGEISENRWNTSSDTDATKPVWNQTINLLPTGINNRFTVTEKDTSDTKKYTGSWDYFDGIPDDEPTRTGGTLYLDYTIVKAWWMEGEIRPYAYFENGNENTMVLMHNVSGRSDCLCVEIPEEGTWTSVRFVRVKKDGDVSIENIYNQTKKLALLKDDNNCCKIEEGKVEDTEERKCSWCAYHSSHTYTPTWTWSSDYSTATLTLECTCGRTVTFEKNVTPVSDEDKDVFTAMVRYQGKVYSDTQTVYKRPTFTGYKLALDGKIGIIYYVDFHRFTPPGTMTFTRENSTSSATLTREDDGSTVYRATCYVAAKEMGDQVTASVTADEKTATNTYSVKEYLERIIKNENGEAGTVKPEQLKALARSMLNYGAKAQLQFGYKTDNLVDDGYDSYTPASPTDLDKLTYSADKFSNYGLKFAGSSLLLTDSTTLRLFFSKDENYDSSTTTLSCKGKTLSPGSKGNYITFDITGIAAPDVLDNQTVTFSKGGNSLVAEFCIRNYISNKYNTGGTLGDVVTALHDYSVKASAYFKG